MTEVIPWKMKRHRQKISLAVLVLLSLFHLKYGIIPGWEKIQDDFPNYYASAKLLHDHKDLSVLYHNESFNEKVKEYRLPPVGQFSLYAPPNALILLPLSGFAPIIAKRIWLCLNILFIFLCGLLIKKISSLDYVSSVNVIFISGFALTNDLFLGQVYLFLTCMILLGILFFRAQKNFLSGILLGVVLALKYVTVIFIPSLLLMRRWKTLLGIISGVLLLYLICLPFFGIDLISWFFSHVFFSHLNGVLYEGRPFALQYQSWDSLLNNLFVYDRIANTLPLINSTASFYAIKFFLMTGVAIILAWFYKQTFRHQYFFDITCSLSLMTLLILEPGSATYHNLFLIVPFILIFRLMMLRESRLVFIYIILFALIGFLPAILNKFTGLHDPGDSRGLSFILSYHRLWLEMIFYLCSVYFLYQFVTDKRFETTVTIQRIPDENL